MIFDDGDGGERIEGPRGRREKRIDELCRSANVDKLL